MESLEKFLPTPPPVGVATGMDSLTQAALGAAVGEALLGKRLGNRALAWGALFGTLPDLDVVVSPLLDNAAMLWWHRGPSHSLLVILLATFLLARPLARLWKREKVTPARAATFVFLALATHVLLDCFNAYGTSVLWPFSSQRVGFNHMFVIDPLFTAPLVVTLVWLAFLRKPKQRPKRRRLLAWGLGLSSAYVSFTVAMKLGVSSAFEADLVARGIDYQRRTEAPTPFNALLWRAVVDRGDEFWVGHRSVFEAKDAPVRWMVYPRNPEALDGYENERETRRVVWFSDGWWIARRHNRGVWMADLRFGEIRRPADRGPFVDLRMPFAWNFEPGATRERLIPARADRGDARQALADLARRIFGGPDTLDGIPRLSGFPGSFPQPLVTIDSSADPADP